MAVKYLPSQSKTKQDVPLPYTASPLRLLWADIRLFFKSLWCLPGVILPLKPGCSGALDEFYPSWTNICNIAIHLFLFVYQIVFLVSLPVIFVFAFPALWIGIYVALTLGVSWVVCRICLNGNIMTLESQVPVDWRPEHDREHWIFVNGIMVGQHWLQNSIDRLAYTFGRRVTGVHNPTFGIVFDIIECLIQRNFSYATRDVRNAYAVIKEALLNPQYKKVILILHSQGGIEGGLVVDWLLDELPRELLQDLEVYTFGNAANHFNNPHRTLSDARQNACEGEELPGHSASKSAKTIRRIEHYVNSVDFVGVWGVLNFANIPNRYMGRVFTRHGSGHQFIQHYLDSMFVLGKDLKTLDTNDFMETEIEVEVPVAERHIEDAAAPESPLDHDDTHVLYDEMKSNVSSLANSFLSRKTKVKDLSRLWLYRNGASPTD
ncbi:uncharacterized protein ACLA_018610 [Aspergillus clavatus NRRL 1]|uniref:DUF676 domain-containing protein n=1 Tax=Aspergillus clavatus (strain ATCC 1007 / CBS 513.65 / DSM 816 / NCTC 3887 / NRRL 1 / QM 1276 / 107) TaxID=344612 RepID=A1CND6_ASPCL|nr:uncharacterized protein ACLA_018610 [Aspergillus clavatus NRRL 1]EAW07157.1 conserved hypothetical protein [Aspergillus clavatus NRRL 1]